MKLRTTPSGLVAEHIDGTWRAVPGDDLLWFLAVQPAVRIEVAQRLGRAEIVDEPAAAPFRPRSFQVVSPWAPALQTPGAVGSHDLGPALACILTRPLRRATPGEAIDAVGGWVVVGAEAADPARPTPHGGATPGRRSGDRSGDRSGGLTMGEDVLTADALPDWTAARGRVRVDGQVWCEGSTAGPAHTLGALLAHASSIQALEVGDVISTGVMPGCRLHDHGRPIPDGCAVELEIDGIGRSTHRAPRPAASPAVQAWARAPMDLSRSTDDRHAAAPAARSPFRPLGG